MITSEAQYRAHTETEQKKGFTEFMKLPSIRLLISMIPPSDRPETIETILFEAFKSGWTQGSGDLAMTFFRSMVSRKQPDLR